MRFNPCSIRKKNKTRRRKKNNLDVTLTGEKNCCFRPKSDKPNNISGTCRKKKIIHKNVGTKRQQQERHRKNVCRVNHDSYRYPSLSLMPVCMTCVYVYLYFYLAYSARFLLPPHIFLYVERSTCETSSCVWILCYYG